MTGGDQEFREILNFWERKTMTRWGVVWVGVWSMTTWDIGKVSDGALGMERERKTTTRRGIVWSSFKVWRTETL